MKFILLVSAVCLLASPAFAAKRKVSSAPATKLSCTGSEPFWGADITIDNDKDRAKVKFERESKKTDFVGIKLAHTNNDGNVLFLKGLTAGRNLYATLINSANRGTPCLGEGEGPDNEFPYELMMMIGDAAYVGCCK